MRFTQPFKKEVVYMKKQISFASKTSNELATVPGKELAKEQIAEAVDAIFNGEREVMRVSFGQFIMQ